MEQRHIIVGPTEYEGVFTVTLSDGPTSGTFTLTVNGDTTGNIPYNATAAQVAAAIALVSADVAGVTGAAGGPWTITFLPSTTDPTLTGDGSLLEAGAQTVDIVRTDDGLARATEAIGISPCVVLAVAVTYDSLVSPDLVLSTNGKVILTRTATDTDLPLRTLRNSAVDEGNGASDDDVVEATGDLTVTLTSADGGDSATVVMPVSGTLV